MNEYVIQIVRRNTQDVYLPIAEGEEKTDYTGFGRPKVATQNSSQPSQ